MPSSCWIVDSLLTRLALAGVVERAGPRRSVLRVTPRFLAHAEGTAGRLRMLGLLGTPQDILESALETWGDLAVAPRRGAHYLAELMSDRDQMASLQPFLAVEAVAVG